MRLALFGKTSSSSSLAAHSPATSHIVVGRRPTDRLPSLAWSLFVFIVPVPRRWPHRQKVIPRSVADGEKEDGHFDRRRSDRGREEAVARSLIAKSPAMDGRTDGRTTDMRDGSKEVEATRTKKRGRVKRE